MNKKNLLRIVIVACLLLVISAVAWKTIINKNGTPQTISKEEAEEIAHERYAGDIVKSKQTGNHFYVTIASEAGEYKIAIDRHSGEVMQIEQTKQQKEEKTLTEEELKDIVSADVNGEIESFQKRNENDVYYDAVVKDQDKKTTIVKVNGDTGEILSKDEQEDKTNKNEIHEKEKVAKKEQKEEEKKEKKEQKENRVKNISEEKAIKIALETVSGEVDDVDLESVNGQLYYFIEIETADDLEAEIQIHAMTGEVVSIEWDD